VFFVLRTEDAVDGVGGAVAGFVVVADLHLAEQADGEQVQAAEQETHGGHHQWTVSAHDRNMPQEFFRCQPNYKSAAAEHADDAQRAEEVQRARKIAEQKADRNQVEENAEGAGNAVVRNAALTVHIADGNFANRGAVPRSQSWNEAVQLAIERNLLEDLAAIGFEVVPKS